MSGSLCLAVVILLAVIALGWWAYRERRVRAVYCLQTVRFAPDQVGKGGVLVVTVSPRAPAPAAGARVKAVVTKTIGADAERGALILAAFDPYEGRIAHVDPVSGSVTLEPAPAMFTTPWPAGVTVEGSLVVSR
jgi:hypothetical protein